MPWPFVALMIGALLTAVLGIYAWIASVRSSLESRLQNIERRADIINERAKHVPSAETVNNLMVAIAGLSTNMANVNQSIEALWRKLDLYEEWFRQREGGSG